MIDDNITSLVAVCKFRTSNRREKIARSPNSRKYVPAKHKKSTIHEIKLPRTFHATWYLEPFSYLAFTVFSMNKSHSGFKLGQNVWCRKAMCCLYCYELKLKEKTTVQSFLMTSTSIFFFTTCFLIGLSKWLIVRWYKTLHSLLSQDSKEKFSVSWKLTTW